MKRFLISSLCLASLAACGSGSGDGGTALYNGYIDEVADFLGDPVLTGYDITDQADIPTENNVDYTGVGLVNVSDASILAARLNVNADFDDNDFSGSLSNIVNDAGDRYSGSIGMAGVLDRTATEFEYQLRGTMAGTISNPTNGTFDVDGTAEGDFYGPDAEAVDFFFEGTADNGAEFLTFDGGGVAVR